MLLGRRSFGRKKFLREFETVSTDLNNFSPEADDKAESPPKSVEDIINEFLSP